MIIGEKVKITGEKHSMVLRVSQLENEKEIIQGKLQAFKKYNKLLFGRKDILGKDLLFPHKIKEFLYKFKCFSFSIDLTLR